MTLINVFLCLQNTEEFCTDFKILLIPLCCFSIVGNPLVCATEKEKNCHGMTLMPMPMNLNNTEGKILSDLLMIFCNWMIFPYITFLMLHFDTFCIIIVLMLTAIFFASLDASPSGRKKAHKMAIAFGLSLGCLSLIVLGERNDKMVSGDTEEQSNCYSGAQVSS